MTETLTELCKRLEHFETPEWAARVILRKEIMTALVIDPCCGIGILSDAARNAGYGTAAFDIHDWGYDNTTVVNFLSIEKMNNHEFTIFMNPPFSLATQFVEKSFELGARKVVMFQRFAFWESKVRREFWEKYPPNRIYICSDRADCWRHDIPKEERGSSSPTAHAWFVFEPGHPTGTLLFHISKADAE